MNRSAVYLVFALLFDRAVIFGLTCVGPPIFALVRMGPNAV